MAPRKTAETPLLIYIAGPFSGPDRYTVELNIRAAEAASLLVTKLGAMPVCPHANTSNPAFEAVQPYQFWIGGTAELLRKCDAAVFIWGWESSSGARKEVGICALEGIPVFYRYLDLKVALEKGTVLKRKA
jgi:hypothetical protein